MALGVDLAGSCVEILRYMGDLTKSNYPFLLGRKTGMLDFLTNPINGSVKLDLNNVQQGKKYVKSRVVYKKRTKACEILDDDSIQDLCTDGAQPEESSVDVTISNRVSTPVREFSNENMINICQDTQSFVREYMISDMRALRERISERLLAAADAAIGKNYEYDGSVTDAGNYKALQILGTSADIGTKVPLYANFSEIGLDFVNNQLNGYPHIIGQGNLQQFMQLMKYSCCNADGVAYDAAIAESGVAFYLDQAANSILGSNKVLSIAPNVLHLLWFNENRNIDMNTPYVQHLVVPDPVYPGLTYDFDFKWDECDKKWKYRLSTWFDLFKAYQADSFGEDSASPSPACEDELVGMTGVFGYELTSA